MTFHIGSLHVPGGDPAALVAALQKYAALNGDLMITARHGVRVTARHEATRVTVNAPLEQLPAILKTSPGVWTVTVRPQTPRLTAHREDAGNGL